MAELITLHQEEMAEKWQEWAAGFLDDNIWQSHGFGKYYVDKKRGTSLVGLVLLESNQPQAMALGFVSKVWPLKQQVLMYRCGPLYRKNATSETANEKKLKAFMEAVENSEIGRSSVLQLLRNSRAYAPSEKVFLRKMGYGSTDIQGSFPMTIWVDLTKDETQLFNDLNGKWRNQLRKCESLSPTHEYGNTRELQERYLKIHASMCEGKNRGDLLIDANELNRLKKFFGENLTIWLTGVKGEDGCGCVVISHKNNAYYMYAATNDLGKKHYMSNAMVWGLLGHLKQRKIETFDLCGIDPKSNPGGYHFKQGIGGEIVEYMGDWSKIRGRMMGKMYGLISHLR